MRLGYEKKAETVSTEMGQWCKNMMSTVCLFELALFRSMVALLKMKSDALVMCTFGSGQEGFCGWTPISTLILIKRQAVVPRSCNDLHILLGLRIT